MEETTTIGDGDKEIAGKKPAPNCTEISIKQFLDFLKTAYQIQGSLEGVLLAGGMTEAVDWLRLKESQLVKAKLEENDTKNREDGDKRELSRRKSDTSTSDSDPLKQKLSEVLSEGLLDSVLPYLVPTASHVSLRKGSITKLPSEKSQSQSMNAIGKRRNSDITMNQSKLGAVKGDADIEIHVCDEVRNLKKDFICNQKLLVEKMGYFAEVTTGQRLEDMDISVHCDVGIFEWLMKWVKRDSLLEDDWPQLDSQNVIPILVSAAFLQMEPLQTDCLLYCHEHMNEILRTNANLSCLNDSILTRLSAMYTNIEVESIRDKKDKIQSRIFTKLIQSLVEPEPESVRGHYCSMARIFKCQKCQQIVTPGVALTIPCLPQCMQLRCDGSIVSQHLRDTAWNINDYILKLYKQLKSWRRVYWRLWSDCHFLFCAQCKRSFPVRQIGWCRYHPDPPQFFTVDAQRAPLPVGRYPCCGERAYRFQLLPDYTGCQFREHTIDGAINTCSSNSNNNNNNDNNVRDTAVMQMLENFRNLIEEQPPQLMFPERLTRLVARVDPAASDRKLVCKENFWWEGFQIVPPRPRLGLLTSFANNKSVAVIRAPAQAQTQLVAQCSGVVNNTAADESSDEPISETTSTTSDSSSSSSSSSAESVTEKTEESNPPPLQQNKKPMRRKRVTKRNGHLWQHNLSARSNQDIQRGHEENAIKEMTAILNRRTAVQVGGDCCGGGGGGGGATSQGQKTKGFCRNITPIGGVWVRLEAEWREAHSIPLQQGKAKNPLTARNRLKGQKFS